MKDVQGNIYSNSVSKVPIKSLRQGNIYSNSVSKVPIKSLRHHRIPFFLTVYKETKFSLQTSKCFFLQNKKQENI